MRNHLTSHTPFTPSALCGHPPTARQVQIIDALTSAQCLANQLSDTAQTSRRPVERLRAADALAFAQTALNFIRTEALAAGIPAAIVYSDSHSIETALTAFVKGGAQ